MYLTRHIFLILLAILGFGFLNALAQTKSTPDTKSTDAPGCNEDLSKKTCETGKNCTLVYYFDKVALTRPSKGQMNASSVSDTKFIGKTYTNGTITCGFKVPTFYTLCDHNSASRLLFVCQDREIIGTTPSPKITLNRKFADFAFALFKENNYEWFLKCASTINCGTSNSTYTKCYGSKNQFVHYDDFLMRGNNTNDTEILTTTHVCYIGISTANFANDSNLKYFPTIQATSMEYDHYPLSAQQPYLYNDYREFQFQPGGERLNMPAIFYYMCGAVDPYVKCNWKDQHIAIENHIRLLNLTFERHLKVKKNICNTEDSKKGDRTAQEMRSFLCHKSKAYAGDPTPLDLKAECACNPDDTCIQYDNITTGCTSQAIHFVEKYGKGTEYMLICQMILDAEITENKKCFEVDSKDADKFHTICCCKSDCKEFEQDTPLKEQDDKPLALQPGDGN